MALTRIKLFRPDQSLFYANAGDNSSRKKAPYSARSSRQGRRWSTQVRTAVPSEPLGESAFPCKQLPAGPRASMSTGTSDEAVTPGHVLPLHSEQRPTNHLL